MSEVTIRLFTPNDQNIVAALYKSGENAHIEIPIVGQCYKWFVNDKLKDDGDISNIETVFMSDSKKGGFWIAEFEGNIVGFVGAYPSTRFTEDYIEIVRMFVSPEVRGKLIGTKLLQAIEEWAIALGYKNMYLTTLAGFPAANVLYPKCGFTLYEGVNIDVTDVLNADTTTTVCVNHYTKNIA